MMKTNWRRLLCLLMTLAMVLPMAVSIANVSAEEAATELPTEFETVAVEKSMITRTATWCFSGASQLKDFSLYQSGTSSFALSDGMLVPNGTSGEMKAILTDTPANIRSVSVDIHPGACGGLTGGLYIGASDAANGANQINAMVFMLESAWSGWSDAPNRIDIVQGQFNNAWKQLSRTITETGKGNALYSGGVKEAVNLKVEFGENMLRLTLSLVSNPDKNVQVMYEVDSSVFDGQVGLRTLSSDTKFDNLKVEYEKEVPENSILWDFSDITQTEDFTLYNSGTSSFAVNDGILKPNGTSGEMKAMFNEDMAKIASVSVDLLPSTSGIISGGVYVGAKNVAAGVDKIDAIEVMVDSNFTGWYDAPNRVDIILGKFAQAWKGYVTNSRFISETGKNNALFADFIKQPLTLKLDFGETTVTATLCLANKPEKFVQTTYTLDAEYFTGQIGLRTYNGDTSYDNFTVTYKDPIEQPDLEQEIVYKNEGYCFYQGGDRPWKLTKELASAPYTLEAWINASESIADDAVGYIVGNASRAPAISLQMLGGKPRLSFQTENADMTIATRNFDVNKDLRNGKWTHVAYTCDVENDTVVCYINGEVAGTWESAGLEAITIPDKLYPGNPFAIGSRDKYDNTYDMFYGIIADVRLWDRPLSASEIQNSMMTQYTTAKDGLLFNAPLAQQVDGVFEDLSGNGNTVAPFDAVLNLQTETHAPGSYSMVVIPDQQMLSHFYPEQLMKMYQWIADNREKENIQMVMSVGDLTDNNGNLTQWRNNRDAWELLPDDLPFIVAPGNHDYDTDSGWNQGHGIREQLTLMNKYFPMSLFEDYPTDIGFFSRDTGAEDNCVNQWQAFEVNGNKYLVFALEFVPQADVFEWAGDVISAHPNHQVIVVTHSYVGSYGNLDVPQMWSDFVSKHENIIMAISGHVWSTCVVRRTDKGNNGNDVYQMLMNAQFSDHGEEGYDHLGMLGLLRFNADGTQCDVSYYSTDRDMYEADSNFTLELPKREKYTAQVGDQSFYAVQDAIDAADGEVVKLLADSDETITVGEDVIIDLAGYSLSNVTVAEGISLKLVDSAATFTGTTGSVKVTGQVEVFTEIDGKTYLVVGQDGVYAPHYYDVAITHISLAPTKDALGYKVQICGDDIVQSHVRNIGINLWLDNGKVLTYEKATSCFTLRLKNILKNNGGDANINANVFASFVINGETFDETGDQQTTTMCQAMQAVDAGWRSYTDAQRNAAKALCDKYFTAVSDWGLDNIYPIDSQTGAITESYDAITGSANAMVNSGFSVKDGKLTSYGASGEAKVILSDTPKGNKTVSVEIHPGSSGKINAGLYLGASNAASAQDSINAMVIMVESAFTDNPNRADILIGSFPTWTQYQRYVIEGSAALFTNGVKEPVTLTVVQNGNDLTITLALVSDPSKSASLSYTYTGDYDLTNGQVGMRSQNIDCTFDNFKVSSQQGSVEYTFDDGSEGLAFYHSLWSGSSVNTNTANTLLMHGGASFTNGTLSAEVNTKGNNEAGIVFGADAQGKNYYLYRVTENSRMELVKVENGVETVLENNYRSMSYLPYSFNRLEVVKNGNMIYCYCYTHYNKILCYAVCEDTEPLTGTYMGLWAKFPGTSFQNVKVTENVENRKAEVLVFGHSYTEMWADYESYFPEYDDMDNIGVCGSTALHWEDFADEVISYEPKLGIYNIGINDLKVGYTPERIVTAMENALLTIKEALPDFRVTLVAVSHCPDRTAYADVISQTNVLMGQLANKYDWMYFADAEYLFCTDPTDPLSTDASYFISDGIHPSAAGYTLMAELIRNVTPDEN